MKEAESVCESFVGVAFATGRGGERRLRKQLKTGEDDKRVLSSILFHWPLKKVTLAQENRGVQSRAGIGAAGPAGPVTWCCNSTSPLLLGRTPAQNQKGRRALASRWNTGRAKQRRHASGRTARKFAPLQSRVQYTRLWFVVFKDIRCLLMPMYGDHGLKLVSFAFTNLHQHPSARSAIVL